jgi:hypothetical protein
VTSSFLDLGFLSAGAGPDISPGSAAASDKRLFNAAPEPQGASSQPLNGAMPAEDSQEPANPTRLLPAATTTAADYTALQAAAYDSWSRGAGADPVPAQWALVSGFAVFLHAKARDRAGAGNTLLASQNYRKQKNRAQKNSEPLESGSDSGL